MPAARARGWRRPAGWRPAGAIIERNRTPLENLRTELQEIAELRNNGLLSADQAGRATQSAQRNFAAGIQSESPSQQQSNVLVRFGGADAYKAIRESRRADEGAKSKIDEKQLKELKEGNKLAQKMLHALEGGGAGGGAPTAGWN